METQSAQGFFHAERYSPSTWSRVMAPRAPRFAPGVASIFAELSLTDRSGPRPRSLVFASRAERFASGAAPFPTELKLAKKRDRILEDRLGGFTSDADVPAQLAQARGLELCESWRRGFSFSLQAWRPSLPSSVSQIGRDGRSALAVHSIAERSGPRPRQPCLAVEGEGTLSEVPP